MVIAGALLAILAVGILVPGSIPFINPPEASSGNNPYIPNDNTPDNTDNTDNTTPDIYSGALYLEVINAVTGTGVTTSTTTVDVVAATNGVFNLISGTFDTKAQAANPQGMNTIWNEGTELIIMPDCTGNPSNGLDYYPAMYYVKLGNGATIYELDSANCFELVSSSPATYRINTNAATPLSQAVAKYTSSNVYYWNLGKLAMYPRQAAADFDMYLSYNGADLASVTDASTWVDTDAEITANATLSDDNEEVTFTMVGGNANLGWGRRFFVVNQNGFIEEYGAVIMFTTNMVGIGKPSGWNTITMSTLYAERGFWKDISNLAGSMPAKGNTAKWSVNLPIDANSATASTAYLFKVYVNDCQKLSQISEVGTSTSVPSAYGFVTSYGVGAVLQNLAMTTSSGAGATEMLRVYLTTAS
jgi:hypothetical protein